MPHSHAELATWLVAFAKRHGEGPWMNVTAQELGLTRTEFRRLLSGKDQMTDDHEVIVRAYTILERERWMASSLLDQMDGREEIAPLEVSLVED
jgi:hypothetical protein